MNGSGKLRRRLLELGLVPRAAVTLRAFAPFGDPIALLVRSSELTLRRADARQVEVKPL